MDLSLSGPCIISLVNTRFMHCYRRMPAGAVAYLRLLREVAPAWKQPEKVPKNKLQNGYFSGSISHSFRLPLLH